MLCTLLGVAPARAADIVARGPAECPDSAELGFRVERSVGMPLAQAPAMTFVVEMERVAKGYAARLMAVERHDEEHKQRSLTGNSCEELADALVVAMTLALGAAEASAASETAATAAEGAAPSEGSGSGSDEGSGSGSDEGSGSGSDEGSGSGSDEGSGSGESGTANVPSGSEDAAGRAEDGPDGDTLRLRPALTVAALVDVGSLPEAGLGAALGAQLSWQRFELRALGTILFERHTELSSASRPTPGADLQLLSGSVLGCSTALGAARFALPLCLGAEVGRLAGVGTGVAAPRSGSALWAAARLDVGARWCLADTPICLGPTLTGVAPITRSRFALIDIGTVYRPPAVAGRLSLDVNVGFD